MSEAILAAAARPYALFDVRLARKVELTPSLARLTFAGPDVRRMKMSGPDHRIKIFFPDAAGRTLALPHDNYLNAYQALDPETRWPRRTYTIRALRADAGEVDVDFVLHGVNGPASAWASSAKPGDSLQIIAPNRAFAGDPGGVEWRPPAGAADILLIGDETALPAIAGILEEITAWPEPPRTQTFIEIPSIADAIETPTWRGLQLEWLPRRGEAYGALMIEAALRAELPASAPANADIADIDVDRDILWDRAAPQQGAFYAWVAGEAGAVKEIRRTLIAVRGLDRSAATLMGYWRLGRALD